MMYKYSLGDSFYMTEGRNKPAVRYIPENVTASQK